jgi:endonuclease/exonuclease/phosphatase family metal-dependent hydrolase
VPDYRLLDGMAEADRARTVAALQRLRSGLDRELPRKTLDDTMLLATWNIRELDSSKYGERTDEAYLYLAEIVSRFDVVAVQEVRNDLGGLRRLTAALGPHWRWIVTDVTAGRSGNGERMSFLYDTRTVEFTGLASELVLPPLPGGAPSEQVARTPFAAGFRAGWATFQLATVHIVYGSDRADDERRVAEIAAVAEALGDRAEDPHNWPRTLVLLGDFNIFSRSDVTMTALEQAGWAVPSELHHIPGSNVPKNKHYDQIAVRADPAERRHFQTTGRAGVLDFFDDVLRDEDEADYAAAMGRNYRRTKQGQRRNAAGRRRYYRAWRTFQLSDHLPRWIEVVTEYSGEYLAAGRAVDPDSSG